MAQLIKVIRSLSSLPQENLKQPELAISCEEFVSYFMDKILFHKDLLAKVEAVCELEALCPSSSPTLE